MSAPNELSTNYEDYNLEEIRDSLIVIAKRAGDMMLQARSTKPTPGTLAKKNIVDLVTETDKAVEAMVSKSLADKYPHFSFLGEETYVPGQMLTPAPTFICDPIDGTTNFVHNYPNFCISLGLSINRKSVVGVIYHPSRHDLYTAIIGKGAFLTHLSTNVVSQLPMQPPQPLTDLQSCLLAVEWGSERSGPNWFTKINTFNHLAASKDIGGKMVHSMRSIGSAALNFVCVARGDIDAYWEGGPWPWDVAAGWIIVEEAGGVVLDGNKSTWENGKAELDSRKFLVVRGAPEGQKELAEEFWEAIQGEFEYEF